MLEKILQNVKPLIYRGVEIFEKYKVVAIQGDNYVAK